jgi:hypothetical protein
MIVVGDLEYPKLKNNRWVQTSAISISGPSKAEFNVEYDVDMIKKQRHLRPSRAACISDNSARRVLSLKGPEVKVKGPGDVVWNPNPGGKSPSSDGMLDMLGTDDDPWSVAPDA